MPIRVSMAADAKVCSLVLGSPSKLYELQRNILASKKSLNHYFATLLNISKTNTCFDSSNKQSQSLSCQKNYQNIGEISMFIDQWTKKLAYFQSGECLLNLCCDLLRRFLCRKVCNDTLLIIVVNNLQMFITIKARFTR